MKSVDKLPLPKGRVTIEIRTIDGDVEKYQFSNLVVEGYRNVVNEFLVGNYGDPVKDIAVGTGGHVVGDINTPVAPTLSDTALEDELIRKNIDSFSRPSVNESEFTVTFATFEAVGDITEAGLYTEVGTLVARVTFPAVPKTGALNMLLTWNLEFQS